jgi:multiple sugar transport system ATP-binding protein
MTMGDKIVLMKDGVVQQIDTPLEIYAKPLNKFVAGFIGSPAMNFFEGVIEKGKALMFAEREGGLRLPIPKKDQARLKGHIGRELTVGLRPEQISIAGTNVTGASRTKAKVTVEVVEPMGNETYIYFSTRKDSPQFVARVNSTKNPATGKPLDMIFDMGYAHFFDQQTEKTI